MTPAVSSALSKGEPVVALESTIISHGMPYPANLEMARAVETIVSDGGAVPATVAVLDGHLHVGLDDAALERLATQGPKARKCSRRDLALCLAEGGVGATTVSGTMCAADMAGVRVFVTGGLGGVHRGYEETQDVSADLTELGRTPVAVVCAGAKSVLDLPRTFEMLETQGVTVATLGADNVPAFFTSDSGLRSHCRVDTPLDAARIMHANLALDLQSGMVLAVPYASGGVGRAIEEAIEVALHEATAAGVRGHALTPFLLRRVNELSAGASLEVNIALVKNNARVGAEMAVQLAALQRSSACEGRGGGTGGSGAGNGRGVVGAGAGGSSASVSAHSTWRAFAPPPSTLVGAHGAACWGRASPFRGSGGDGRACGHTWVGRGASPVESGGWHWSRALSTAALCPNASRGSSLMASVGALRGRLRWRACGGQNGLHRGGQRHRLGVGDVRLPGGVCGQSHCMCTEAWGDGDERLRLHPGSSGSGAERQLRRALVVGGAVVDILARPATGRELVMGTSNPGTVVQQFGGVARNIAEAMARLGAAPAFLTAIGSSGPASVGLQANLRQLDIAVLDTLQHRESPVWDAVDDIELEQAAARAVIPATDVGKGAGGSAGKAAGVRTAVYMAVLDGSGDLLTAVADMTCFDHIMPRHVQDIASPHVRGSPLVVADANISADVLRELAFRCRDAGVPLWFEPTSVAKAVRVVEAGALPHTAVVSPNVDEVFAMAAAVAERHGCGAYDSESSDAQSGSDADSGPFIHDTPPRLRDSGSDGDSDGDSDSAKVGGFRMRFSPRDTGGAVCELQQGENGLAAAGAELTPSAAGARLVAGAVYAAGDSDDSDSAPTDGDVDGSELELDGALLEAVKTVLACMALPGGTKTGETATAGPSAPVHEAGCCVDGRRHVVVTMGARGVLWASAPVRPEVGNEATALLREVLDMPFFTAALALDVEFDLLPASPVDVVNSSGAGDTLVGGAAWALCRHARPDARDPGPPQASMRAALEVGMAAARHTLRSEASVAPELSVLGDGGGHHASGASECGAPSAASLVHLIPGAL